MSNPKSTSAANGKPVGPEDSKNTEEREMLFGYPVYNNGEKCPGCGTRNIHNPGTGEVVGARACGECPRQYFVRFVR